MAKFKKIKNKGFWFIFIIYILLTIADITTTYMNGDLKFVLETNPLYRSTKTFMPLFILNIIYIMVFYWWYNRYKTSVFVRFFLINNMLVISFARIYAIKNAIYWYMHPVTIEQATQIATPEVIATSQLILGFLIYFPMLLTLLTYTIWKIDHKIERRDLNE